MSQKSAKSQRCIFRQVCELIPPHLVSKLAKAHKIASRKYTPWSHVVSLLHAQFLHALGLNDVSVAYKQTDRFYQRYEERRLQVVMAFLMQIGLEIQTWQKIYFGLSYLI